MFFKRDYLNEFIHPIEKEKLEKVQALWLWYDFHTEMYDRNLGETVPSKNDETAVIPIHPKDKSLSMKYAGMLREQMTSIAKHHNIDLELLHSGRRDVFRREHNMAGRINMYMQYAELGRMDFILKGIPWEVGR